MQELDLRGKTLAELRQLNALLDTERFAEQEALRTEYLETKKKFHTFREREDGDFDRKRGELIEKHRADMEALEDAYKRLGMEIGVLMDKRRFCGSADEADRLRAEIETAMDGRHELRRQRRTVIETYYDDMRDLKDRHQEQRKLLHDALSETERDIRKKRVALAKKYAALHEEVRKHIGQILKEERLNENFDYSV